jgi:hypothetical protein
MGQLYYGADTVPTLIPDRLLSHLKVVIATKLRRSESFTLSWTRPSDPTAGRSTIWLQPAIPLRFVFDESEPEQLDPALLRTLADQANGTGGISVNLDQDIDVPVRGRRASLATVA